MNGFCCVTTYFNPAGYRSRADNYRVFADRLADQGVRLVTVELAFGHAPFVLPASDAVVRLRGTSVLWQKERLLNHAWTVLPADCDRVAWVDGDLLFADADWPEQAAAALDRCDVVQLFSEVHHLAPGVTRPGGQVVDVDDGLMWQAAEFPDWVERRQAQRLPFAVPGYAWAARRSVLAATGLYDRLVLGNGDAYWADCLLDCFGMHHYWHARTPGMAADMDAWLARFTSAGRPRVGHVPGRVYHLWHGRFADRKYRERDAILAAHAFDPAVDVAVRNGVYEWSSDKPGLHAAVHDYFRSRVEDRSADEPVSPS